MSTINTNGLNVNYPIPGENNSTQGFRDNFASIKTNLDTAGTEITDLQNKVVLKAALNGSVLNNDMANTLISNASTRSFRATTYNLGNALSGTVLVNVAQADVQYGNVAGNVTLQFGSWAPTNTESAITLRLGFPPGAGNTTSTAIVTFPSQVVALNNNFGGTILENSANIANITITAPHDVQQLEFKLRTLDCGNTITIEPINRPYQSTQIVKRTPPSTGQVGDKIGTVCLDTGAVQLLITGANTDPFFTTTNTSTLYTGQAVIATGTSLEANIVVGTTYYVRNVVNSTQFTLSSTPSGSNIAIGANATGTAMFLNPTQYMYIAVDDYSANFYNRNITSTTLPNIITVSGSTANLAVNNPIIFAGNALGNTANIELNTVYYINSVSGSNVTISKTRYNGVAGPEYTNITTVGSGNVNIDYTVYEGPDIFRRTPLEPF
jgi:predicted ribosome-associated RNA-binding protein Tma20